MTLTVYTDGACLGNPGPGGWAWAVPGGAWASGAEPATTNQRMEVMAAAEAVRVLGPDHPAIEIVSDSTYVVKCFNERWWLGWRKRGWKNSQRKPVANRDLWEPFIDAVLAHGGITFTWVKGHSDDPGNDLVDALATEAARTQQGQSSAGGVSPDRSSQTQASQTQASQTQASGGQTSGGQASGGQATQGQFPHFDG